MPFKMSLAETLGWALVLGIYAANYRAFNTLAASSAGYVQALTQAAQGRQANQFLPF